MPDPRYLQRCLTHDYSGIGIYMITLFKAADLPDFTHLTGNLSRYENTVRLYPSDMWFKLREAMSTFLSRYRGDQLSLIRDVIMPDHRHSIFYVKRQLPDGKTLGNLMSEFKGLCTAAIRTLPGIAPDAKAFEKGYHDRICFRRGQLDNMVRYVDDNPRRLFVKIHHPHLFRRQYRIVIDGESYDAMGNIFLLEDPDRQAVIVHRRWSDSEREVAFKGWERCVENGGVLVSPFISEAERGVKQKALEAGGKVIKLMVNGFGERFKPYGRDFDRCAAGQMLLLAPVVHETRRVDIMRSQCLHLNDIAVKIASMTSSELSRCLFRV